jgi:cytoskeletal protein CcmA (bactofilin family)
MAAFKTRQGERFPGEHDGRARFSCIDRGSKVNGRLSFVSPVLIEGQIEGEVQGTEIIIARGAIISAQVRAISVVVLGTVTWDITASERIEVRSTATLTGNITAPTLIIEEGAVFEGQCAIMALRSNEPDRTALRPWLARTTSAHPS